MTDQEIIEILAEFMGWHKHGGTTIHKKTGEMKKIWWWVLDGEVPALDMESKDWNPLESWDDWRMVEERMLEDESLYHDFMDNLTRRDIDGQLPALRITCYLSIGSSDLRTRCENIVSILKTIENK